MVIWIEILEARSERLALGIAVGILLAQVPVDGQVMGETRNQFAVVQLALCAKGAAVQQLVVLRLLCDHVKLDAQLVHVREDDLPLGQLGAVKPVTLAVGGPRPDVVAVTGDIHGQEVDRIHPLAGQVIQSANDVLALGALPARISGVPVAGVRVVVMGSRRAVELVIGKKVLRTVSTALEVPFARFRKLQKVLAHVAQRPLAAEVTAALVRSADRELTGIAVKVACAAAGAGVQTDRDVRTASERSLVVPGALLVGCEIHAPLGPACRPGLCRIAIGRVVARHVPRRTAGCGERDLKTVITKRICPSPFARRRAVEGNRHLMPLLQFTFDQVRLADSGANAHPSKDSNHQHCQSNSTTHAAPALSRDPAISERYITWITI